MVFASHLIIKLSARVSCHIVLASQGESCCDIYFSPCPMSKSMCGHLELRKSLNDARLHGRMPTKSV